MIYKTYEEHNKKWNSASELISSHNRELIKHWDSIPWWKFWVEKPSFEERREIIINNWRRFERLPIPRLMDYFKTQF